MAKNDRENLTSSLGKLSVSVYDSLLGTESAPDSPYQLLPLSDIHPNPDQARHYFDTAALHELAESIKEHGVIQPIVVRPRAQGGYSIVAGERRYRASIHAELTEIPAIIKSFESNDDVLEITAIENLQREDLTLYETINALMVMQERSNLSGRDIAKRLGKTKTWVLERLKIGADPELMAKVKEGAIGLREARDLSVKEKTIKSVRQSDSNEEAAIEKWAAVYEEATGFKPAYGDEQAVSQGQNGPQWVTGQGTGQSHNVPVQEILDGVVIWSVDERGVVSPDYLKCRSPKEYYHKVRAIIDWMVMQTNNAGHSKVDVINYLQEIATLTARLVIELKAED